MERREVIAELVWRGTGVSPGSMGLDSRKAKAVGGGEGLWRDKPLSEPGARYAQEDWTKPGRRVMWVDNERRTGECFPRRVMALRDGTSWRDGRGEHRFLIIDNIRVTS